MRGFTIKSEQVDLSLSENGFPMVSPTFPNIQVDPHFHNFPIFSISFNSHKIGGIHHAPSYGMHKVRWLQSKRGLHLQTTLLSAIRVVNVRRVDDSLIQMDGSFRNGVLHPKLGGFWGIYHLAI
jgi:hypothetical protein